MIECDFCVQQGLTNSKAKYDCRTSLGPWANVCESHFRQYGVGLGLGKGQKLDKLAYPYLHDVEPITL